MTSKQQPEISEKYFSRQSQILSETIKLIKNFKLIRDCKFNSIRSVTQYLHIGLLSTTEI